MFFLIPCFSPHPNVGGEIIVKKSAAYTRANTVINISVRYITLPPLT
jgi:hypothetical protein